MPLIFAILCGIASAIVYGAATVVQHGKAQQHADHGREHAAGLWLMLRSPVFLLAVLGDGVGFVLQVVALSLGPVVLIQPLVVLMLPVSLAVSFAMTRRRPSRADYLGLLGVLGGLTIFLGLIGRASGGQVPRPQAVVVATAAVLMVGLVAAAAARGRGRRARAAVYGAVAGAYFGALAVLVDAASSWASTDGYEGLLETAKGLVPLSGIVVLGIAGMIFTQLSFQIGALGATLPANLAVDPLVAVLLGVTLLGEHVPHSPALIGVYLLCLAAVAAGAVRLANPQPQQTSRAPSLRDGISRR